jgi:hypothetical protein
MQRAFYSDSISNFSAQSPEEIMGILATNNTFALEGTQRDAWQEQIRILQCVLEPHHGTIFLEYSIPRMGKRIDALLLIGAVIFVLEFKVGERDFTAYALDQVCDYALDLKNFHETSHHAWIAPILIATRAKDVMTPFVVATPQDDKLLLPIKSSSNILGTVIQNVLRFADGTAIDRIPWEEGRYHPTPSIVEAAMALYNGHAVEEISRSDASAINLSQTSNLISKIISESKAFKQKSICFVTGVPGAGKTLVGLNIATKHIDKNTELYSVFLSGNGPLVAILREALARDKVRHEKDRGVKVGVGKARSEVAMFIQNVHHFRDECLRDEKPPVEHVALFDEAQRAWDLAQTSSFMRRKKGHSNFSQSEPEFLLSCLDRHEDWAVVVCLVGGGQEINTGEAGISEWIESLERSFRNWRVYISSRLMDSEYGAGNVLELLSNRRNVVWNDDLHLSVSMRSFRAENVSLLVKQLLDLDGDEARATLRQLQDRYPVVLTRDLAKAKLWLKEKARGSERYGLMVSSQAERLKPHAIFVKAPMDPVHWFLDRKDDTRSSFYLEDAATEFAVQGLELDWACVTWDGDFRYSKLGWEHRSFSGSTWKQIKSPQRQAYLKNAYRVLLTRARQGMVIVVPHGDEADATRSCKYYDPTYEYLRSIGFAEI